MSLAGCEVSTLLNMEVENSGPLVGATSSVYDTVLGDVPLRSWRLLDV